MYCVLRVYMYISMYVLCATCIYVYKYVCIVCYVYICSDTSNWQVHLYFLFMLLAM